MAQKPTKKNRRKKSTPKKNPKRLQSGVKSRLTKKKSDPKEVTVRQQLESQAKVNGVADDKQATKSGWTSWLAQPVGIHSHGTGFLTRQRSLAPAYVRNAWSELRQVSWPKFPLVVRLTFAVFVFSAVFTALVALLDWALTAIFEEIILHKAQNIKDFLQF